MVYSTKSNTHELSILLQSFLATSLSNIDSSRVRNPSYHSRSEGWSEVFGNLEEKNKKDREDKEERLKIYADWKSEDDFVRSTKEATFKKSISKSDAKIPQIQLKQYRVAWQEQLVLRIAEIPHIVTNASHIATESTGPLPLLVDLEDKAFVGRHNAGGMATSTTSDTSDISGTPLSSSSDIVHYILQKYPRKPFADVEFTPQQRAQSLTITSMIQDQLNVIISALRYGDSRSWEDIYRNQCFMAYSDPNGENEIADYIENLQLDDTALNSDYSTMETGGNKSGCFNISSRFQAWSERTVAMKNLTLSNLVTNRTGGGCNGLFYPGGEVNIDTALSLAKSCYEALDGMLERQADSSGTQGPILTILGTSKSSLVDTALFAHLAEALCDIHIVAILAEYKHLVQFFRVMYEKYFGRKYTQKMKVETRPISSMDNDMMKGHSWISCNNRCNAMNQFNRIPIGNGHKSTLRTTQLSDYREAIKIMQSVALHCHDLQEVLADVRIQRIEEKKLLLRNKRNNVENMLQRLLLGGDMRDDLSISPTNNRRGRSFSTSSQADKEEEKEGGDENEKDENDFAWKNKQHMKKMKREAKQQDELWIGGIVISTFLGFALSMSK